MTSLLRWSQNQFHVWDQLLFRRNNLAHARNKADGTGGQSSVCGLGRGPWRGTIRAARGVKCRRCIKMIKDGHA